MEETAYAKINLALHVRAREKDGYHRIETLFAFCEEGDRLSVSEGNGLRLEITGPFAEGLNLKDNLVLRAARALAEWSGIAGGAALALDKRLPVASGIGGGSADAAAALRLLRRWWQVPIADRQLMEVAGSLGADVPACVLSVTCRGDGRGDDLRPLGDGLSGSPVLLVNPRAQVSTASVFGAWDGIDHGPLPEGELLDCARHGRNDLEAPARRFAPEIRDVLETLGSVPGALLVRMSGSGATCFALFAKVEERDAAAAFVAERHPDWWQLATRLR